MNTERTALFLMANLGSEVSRLLSALDRDDSSMAKNSKQRVEKMLDEVELFPEMHGRQMEMKILRSVLSDFSKSGRRYKVSSNELKDYFTPFATRLMRK